MVVIDVAAPDNSGVTTQTHGWIRVGYGSGVDAFLTNTINSYDLSDTGLLLWALDLWLAYASRRQRSKLLQEYKNIVD